MKILMNILIIFLLPVSSTISQEDKIKIIDPWMRVAAESQTSALFFKIKNVSESADTLYKVDFDFAEKVEIHETYMIDDMMGMREIDFVVVEPNSTFELKPRAHHVMLIKLEKDFKKGDEGEVTLHFKQAGKIMIKAEVKEMMKEHQR